MQIIFPFNAVTRRALLFFHRNYGARKKLIKPFQRYYKELHPSSYTLGPSRVRSGSPELGLPQTEWPGPPASRYGDAVACTTS